MGVTSWLFKLLPTCIIWGLSYSMISLFMYACNKNITPYERWDLETKYYWWDNSYIHVLVHTLKPWQFMICHKDWRDLAFCCIIQKSKCFDGASNNQSTDASVVSSTQNFFCITLQSSAIRKSNLVTLCRLAILIYCWSTFLSAWMLGYHRFEVTRRHSAARHAQLFVYTKNKYYVNP